MENEEIDLKREFSERLRTSIKRLGLSMKEFAESSGMSYRTLQQYTSGEQFPGGLALLRLSVALGVTSDWLLTGIGDRHRVDDPEGRMWVDKGRVIRFQGVAVDTADCESPIQEASYLEDSEKVDLPPTTETAERAMFAELGLQDLYLKARRGQQELSWTIIKVLRDRRGVASWRDVLVGVANSGTPCTEMDLRSDLAVLVHRGLVSQGPKGYELTTKNPALAARETGDISQATKDAVKRLVLEIVPVAERADGRGYVLDAAGRVKAGSEKEFVARIREAVHGICLELQDDNGQPVHLVLGVSLDANAVIKHKVGEE
jgi:transcriptional regulator with XRE-family HTH domain